MNMAVEASPNNWEDARNAYATLVFKFKIKQDDSNPFNKKISFTPRSLEISQLKMMNGNEESTTEQMMLQSMANLQLEGMKKMFKEFPVQIGDIVKKNPPQIACLGVNLSDLDISFKKSMAQFTAYFKDVPYADKAFCEKFMAELKTAPSKFKEQMDAAKESPMFKQFAEQVETVEQKAREAGLEG